MGTGENYEQILPGYHDGLPEEFQKLAQLIEADQFELIEGSFRLVYLMNDAVESFLVFENARMTGSYDRNYEGELRASLETKGTEYVLVVHQDDVVFTMFFSGISLEIYLYDYGTTGHFWVEGYEYLRQIEYKIAIVRDKYRYLGSEYCNDIEKKLVALAEFPPLNYCCYPAVSEKYLVTDGNDWIVTKEAFDTMFYISEAVADMKMLRVLKQYQKTQSIYLAKKIARMLHRNKHKKIVDFLTGWIAEGASGYEKRAFGDMDKEYQAVLEVAKARKKQLEKEGKDAWIFREEPFVYAKDSIEFQAYVMVWKHGIWNRKVTLEKYSINDIQ